VTQIDIHLFSGKLWGCDRCLPVDCRSSHLRICVRVSSSHKKSKIAPQLALPGIITLGERTVVLFVAQFFSYVEYFLESEANI